MNHLQRLAGLADDILRDPAFERGLDQRRGQGESRLVEFVLNQVADRFPDKPTQQQNVIAMKVLQQALGYGVGRLLDLMPQDRLPRAAARGAKRMKIYQYQGAQYREAIPGTQEEIPGVGDQGMTWPVYRSEEQKEREQVQALFGLGGGELMDEPWLGHAYWYEEAPEWDHDFREEGDYQYRTGIEWGYSKKNEVQTDEDGVEWEVVKSYRPPTEVDCWDCGAGTGNWWPENFEQEYGRAPGPGDECGLCETEFEGMPGVVYDGEAHEVLFRTHNRNIWPEDY